MIWLEALHYSLALRLEWRHWFRSTGKALTLRVGKSRIRPNSWLSRPQPRGRSTMRKVVTVVFTGLLIQLGMNYADACGDKTMRVKTSLRYYETEAARRPSRILIHSAALPPGIGVQLGEWLKKVGHKATAMDDVNSIKNSLRTSHYDLVLTNLAEAPQLQKQVESFTPRTTVVPVLLKSPKSEVETAKTQYKVTIKNPKDGLDFLIAVAKVMDSRSKRS